MNPIILIPGIQGTRLSNVNHYDYQPAWSGLRKFFQNIYHLLLNKDGLTDAAPGIIIDRQDVEDFAYAEIVNFLRNRNYPVYIFGYDWRKSNEYTGQRLADYLHHLRLKHPHQKISVLTHSMGALVFSAFARQHSQRLSSAIHKVIFTCPPFLGSHEALYTLLIGRSKLFNSSDDFRKIARTFPAIYELCPLYPDALRFKNGAAFNLYNYKHWQQNPQKPGYQATRERITHRLSELQRLRHQNHHIFDYTQLPAAVRQRFLVIAGRGETTQRQVQVDANSRPVRNRFHFSQQGCDEEGDGTVHLQSAACFKEHITTLALKSNWLENRLDGRVFMSDWHTFFLNNGRVQNIIQRFLQKPAHKLHPDWFRSPANDEALL